MNIDGYALIEINKEGNYQLKEENGLEWLHPIMDVCFEDAEGTEQLMDELIKQNPGKEFKDMLIMVFFSYTCNASKGYEGDWDVDEIYNLVSYQIVRESYQEFNRANVTEIIELNESSLKNLNKHIPLDEEYKNRLEQEIAYLIGSWEEFYDEDFVRTEKKVNSDMFFK